MLEEASCRSLNNMQNDSNICNFTSNRYHEILVGRIRQFRSNRDLCDVTLEADGVLFPAHRVILAAASSYFKLLFSEAKVNGNVKLKDVRAKGLRNVLDFIYSNKLSLTLTNVEETLKAAKVLMVREAEKLCFQFLEDRLNQGTCVAILNIVKKHSPKELKEKATSTVLHSQHLGSSENHNQHLLDKYDHHNLHHVGSSDHHSQRLVGISDHHSQRLVESSDHHSQRLVESSDHHNQRLVESSDHHNQCLVESSDHHNQRLVESSDHHKQRLVESFDHHNQCLVESFDHHNQRLVESSDHHNQRLVESSDHHNQLLVESSHHHNQCLVESSDHHNQRLVESSDHHSQHLVGSSDHHSQRLVESSDHHSQRLVESSDHHNQRLVGSSDHHNQHLVGGSDQDNHCLLGSSDHHRQHPPESSDHQNLDLLGSSDQVNQHLLGISDHHNLNFPASSAHANQHLHADLNHNNQHLLGSTDFTKQLDKRTFCEILDCNNISVASELELFRMAVEWLQYDSSRLKDSGDILRKIRFPLIPLEELQKYVKETLIMKTDSDCFRYLQEALRYHSQIYAQPVLRCEGANMRCSSEHLLVLGGRTADNKVCSSIWLQNQDSNSWYELVEMCSPVYNHCVAVINDFLFIIGGQTKFDPSGKYPSNEVFRFDPRTGSWLQVAGMLERRTRFHAEVIGERIIVVGGGSLLGHLTPSAEEYYPADNKWEYTTQFPIPVADHAGTTHKGILYISGGYSTNRTQNDFYSYLPRLKRWVVNRSMTYSRCDHGMATIGDKIFCVGGRTLNAAAEWIHVNETEYYCPAADQWSTLKLSPFGCCQFSISSFQSKLFIAGGGSLRRMNKEDGVFVYDPESKEWKKTGSLPYPLVDHASCVIHLPRAMVEKLREKNDAKPSTPNKKRSTLNLFITGKQEV